MDKNDWEWTRSDIEEFKEFPKELNTREEFLVVTRACVVAEQLCLEGDEFTKFQNAYWQGAMWMAKRLGFA